MREQLSDAYDGWLRGRLADRPGLALAAAGSLGRREPAPHSDLDLVLLYEGRIADLTDVADAIWYPIWDAKVGLDHAVRTPDQAVDVAKRDLRALLGLLNVRHVAGDVAITTRVRDAVLDLWRASALRRIGELDDLARRRWTLTGEAAYLLEPNLKESRGGLRDALALRALAMAQLVDYPVRVRAAYSTLLDVRGEAQRVTGRADDVLHQQDHDAVAAALRITGTDDAQARDVLLRGVNDAARTIAHACDLAGRRVEAQAVRATTGRRRRWTSTGVARAGLAWVGAARVGLARDVVAQDGEVVLARDADPRTDPGLVLRVARAGAEHDLPIAEFALTRLSAESAPMPEPWPPSARDDLLGVLGAGQRAIPVLESLDQAGLFVSLLPEWDAVRSRAQHNPVHRYTVDRHLLATAAATAELEPAPDVRRRDLLIIGALLHDIGKGYPPDDHSVVGARVAETVAARLGYTGADLDTVVGLVRHHLLLPKTATRRDLDDPKTIGIVREAVADDPELLDLLHALTRADAAATGPAAWSEWKASLVADLVRRVHAAIGGSRQPSVPPLDAERVALAEAGELAVVVRAGEVVVAAPDAAGTLSRTAGVLALHSLDVRQASIRTHAGMAVNIFTVEPRFSRMPDPALVRGDLARALRGQLGLAARLAEKDRTYSRHSASEPPAPLGVHWFDDATAATVVEFRGRDEIGLLSRITAALERAGLDVQSARVSSAAGAVVDAFYVTQGGAQIPPDRRADLTAVLRRA